MSLFKKPSELEIKPTIKALIYGEPGIGKSTLALSAPNPVVFDFDGGITRVNAAFQCPTLQISDVKDERGNIKKLAWDVVREAMLELKQNNDGFKTIVIDTAGKMLDYMSDYIVRTDRTPKHLMSRSDGQLSQQGYGARKNMFIQFNKECALLGMNVIYVAHAKEEKKKKNNEDFVYNRPDISGSSSQDLIKELDLVGYARADGYKRTITWCPSDEFYAKNACNLPAEQDIPVVVGQNGTIGKNTFMSEIFKDYEEYLSLQKSIRGQYEKLMSRINETISKITTADDANKMVSEIKDGEFKKDAIWDSQLRAANGLKEKCDALGFKYNKESGKYEAA